MSCSRAARPHLRDRQLQGLLGDRAAAARPPRRPCRRRRSAPRRRSTPCRGHRSRSRRCPPRASGTSPGDAVHDDVVDRDAQRRRIAPVVQEGRDPSSVADDALGETVELAGLDPRDHPLAHRVQHLVDDPVRLIHQLDLARGLEHRGHHSTAAPSSAATPNSSNIRGRHLFDRTVAVDLAQQAALPIVTDQGRGFFPVDPQALPDHVLLVVRPARAAAVAADQLVLRHVHQQHGVERPGRRRGGSPPASRPGAASADSRRAGNPGRASGLASRSRTTSAIVASSTRAPEAMMPCTLFPSSVPSATASRSMSPVEMLGTPRRSAEHLPLRALAGAGGAQTGPPWRPG